MVIYREWINKSKLKKIKQIVKPHPNYIPNEKPQYVKLFISTIFSELEGRVIYLDSDIIVQGKFLYLTKKMACDPEGKRALSRDLPSHLRAIASLTRWCIAIIR